MIGNATTESTARPRRRTFTGQQLASTTVGANTNRYLYDPYGNTDCVVDSSWNAATCPTPGNAVLLTD